MWGSDSCHVAMASADITVCRDVDGAHVVSHLLKRMDFAWTPLTVATVGYTCTIWQIRDSSPVCLLS